MAGIAGVIGLKKPDEAVARVESMLNAMSYESFYKKGIYRNDELRLCVGWVVHPNSFSDCMPVQSPDGSITIVVSGEIFTSPERLQRLRRAGGSFSDSDASHLSDLYQELGTDFFSELNGTFCGVLADTQRRTLQLFNDRMGFEKLYFNESSDGNGFHFASESKALLRVLPERRQFSTAGLAQFLGYGCTLGETTLFNGISLIPPASVWEFAPDTPVRKRTYFRPQDWKIDASIGPKRFQERFDETFQKILPRYFAGKLHPGISLTGGWDTRMIMACQRAESASLPCFTFAGPTGDTVDVQQAGKVAALLNQNHFVVRLQSDFIEDFAKHAEHTVYASDGNGDVCLSHEMYLNRLARDLAGARITGNFGSEVLRGEATIKENLLRSRWAVGELKEEIAKARGHWNVTSRLDETNFAVFSGIPWKLSTTFRLANSQLPTRSPFLDNDILKLACSCPLSIRKDSQFPIALIRSQHPQLLAISTDRGEAGDDSMLGKAFRRAFYAGTFKLDYMLNEGMPDLFPVVLDIAGIRRALTFGHKYLEYRRWFRGPLRGYVDGMLNHGNSFVSGLIGKKSVERVLNDHVSGMRNHLETINVWLTLELINKSLLRIS